MGCKQKEQRPEENEIYIFFHKLRQETELDYTIKGYEKNYEQILFLSKNIFKKLEKKQNVRINFVNELMKYINKINITEKEDHNTKKILFCTLVLTLTLKNFLKENANNYIIKANNDLQQSLLTFAVEILNHEFENKENLKLVIYYQSKMLYLLFKEMNDINQYINIEKFIDKLNSVADDNNILKDKEKYNFHKLILACLGEFFIHNYKEFDFKMKYIDIVMNYFMYVFWENSSFIGRNYEIYKSEIFSENYLFNINEIIAEREKKENDNLMNSYNKKKSLMSIKLVDSIISKNNSNIADDKFSVSIEKLIKMRRNQSFIDLNQINENFYFFFKSIIHDISNGKDIFNNFFEHIKQYIKKMSNDDTKYEVTDFRKTNEILLLLLFAKCKINCDNVVIYSFIEFETEYIKNNFKSKEFIFEFAKIFTDLFQDDKDIYNRNLKLLGQIFLIETEKNEQNDEFLIESILEKKNKLFISFLSRLIKILKEEEYDIETITYVIEKINEILENEINKFKENKKNKKEKSIMNKEDFSIIFKYFNFKKKKNETIEDKEYLNSFINLFVKILSYIDYYFSLNEVYQDISLRNLLYKKIISAITKLLILKIDDNENNNNYIQELIDFLKNLISIIKKNGLNFFVDFEIIHKYLNYYLYKISKIENDVDIYQFKLIYSISIFIISQLKIIYGIPTSIINLHNDIVKIIYKKDEKLKDYLNDININEYKDNSSNKKHKKENKFYQYLSKFYSNSQKNKDKIILNNQEFKYYINIIQNKLYGKKSPLIIYYKSQDSKITYTKTKIGYPETYENLKTDEYFDDLIIDEERNINDSLIISINGSNTNIMEMSLISKKKEYSEMIDASEENSYFNDNDSQNIYLPSKDQEEINKNINIANDLNSSFKEEKSINDFKI